MNIGLKINKKRGFYCIIIQFIVFSLLYPIEMCVVSLVPTI